MFKPQVRLLVHIQHSSGLKSERVLIFPERRYSMLPTTRRETLKAMPRRT
jgi:hypothetical protein